MKKQHLVSKINQKSNSDSVLSVNLISEMVHSYWLDLGGRETWIHSHYGIGDDEGNEPGMEYRMSTTVIKNLHMLNKANSTAPVTIHLHSCGGDFVEGMAIYDTLKLMPYHKKIIAYTHARSMSSIVFLAGDERIMLPHGYFMFHRGTFGIWADALTVYSNVEWAKKQDDQMMKIYIDALKTKGKFKSKSEKWIEAMLNEQMNQKADCYLSAEEALQWGFVDKILEKF